MRVIYAFAVQQGLKEEAEGIYASVREALSTLDSEGKSGYWKGVEDIIESFRAEWAIQEQIQTIITNGGSAVATFDKLTSRVESDSRNFFKPSIVARAAGELSEHSDLHGMAVDIFELSIRKLAVRRGETDWLSEEVVQVIKDSSLSDGEKDRVFLTLLEAMWPRQKHPITKFIGMRDDETAAMKLFKELLSEDKHPRSKAYLLARVSDSIEDLDPRKHGKKLEGEYGISVFAAELKAIAYIADCLKDRREVPNPENFTALLALYPNTDTALQELEDLFPHLVKAERAKGKTIELPTVAEVENGNFDPQELRAKLPNLLMPTQPKAVWGEAFAVLEAWLRYDALTILSEKEIAEEKKKDKRRDVYVDMDELRERDSFQVAWRVCLQHLKVDKPNEFQQRAFATVLNVKTGKEAKAKACIGYSLLRDSRASLAVKQLSFNLLTRSEYLPAYVKHVYDEKIKGALSDEQLEFFNDVAMWDHATPVAERPSVLWAHLFEDGKEERVLLRTRIQRMLAQGEQWRPDLTVEEDWWVMLHFLDGRWWSTGFEQYCVALEHQRHVRQWSLKERILHYAHPRYDSESYYEQRERMITDYLLDNRHRLEQIKDREIIAKYDELFPRDDDDDRETTLRVLREDFQKKKGLYLEYKQAIEQNRPPKIEDRYNYDEALTVFELLKIWDKIDPNDRLDLRTILETSFPALDIAQIDRLYDLAVNPFQIKEDTRREGGETVGKSKGWWSQMGYNYYGERIWHEAVLEATRGKLSSEQEDALLTVMYPFSKTFYYNRFGSLHERFPFTIPQASYSYRKSADGNVVSVILPCFASCSDQELDQIERRIPVYARKNLARSHTMSISGIEIPKNLQGHADFALFLFKAYFRSLEIGPREQLAEELKDLGKNEALKRFFELRDLIKPGQMLADRPEVPHDYRDLLAEFRDKVAPSDIEEVRNVIESELGWENGSFKLVRLINSGSMGEVWLVEHQGYPIPLAVKVLPNSKEKKIKSVMEEMENMREKLDWYRDISTESAIAIKVLDRLLALMRQELDYRNDKKNWEKLFGLSGRVEVNNDGTVAIPGTDFWTAMYYQATPRTLVTSYVDGVNLLDKKSGIRTLLERKTVASQLWQYLQGRIVQSDNGLYPLDLHLGNILREVKSGKLVLVDTGQVGKIAVPQERELLTNFVIALFMRNTEDVVNILEQIGDFEEGEELDREGLLAEVTGLMSSDRSEAELIERLFVRSRYHGLSIKDSFMDMLKATVSFRGTATALDPEFQFTLTNISCGTICEAEHEGSYNALDSQLERQFGMLRNTLGITEERDLTEEESDEALVKLGYANTVQELQVLRSKIREEAEVSNQINIFFSIPEGGTELFWVGNDYGAGHYNRAGTRMHISLPFIQKRGGSYRSRSWRP